MEKPPTTTKTKKNKFLKLIPSAVSFQNLPFSPRRDKRPAHQNKGFSGPMIPAEARRKSRNFETQEPTSPKVSCMGQVKHKNKISKKKHVSLPKEFKPAPAPKPDKSTKTRPAGPDTEVKKKRTGMKKIFRRKAGGSVDLAEPAESAPRLSQMRKFASSRETFANFDWTAAQIAPEEDREFYSDGEREYSDGDDDVSIPFSAPILMGSGGGGVAGVELEPRKEINLWKRRTMARPTRLELNIDGEN